MAYRLLLASEFYPPFIGGAELQTQILARGLAHRGHAVAVVTAWHEGQKEYELDEHGVEVFRMLGWSTRVAWFSSDPKRRFHPPLPDPGTTMRMRKLLHQFRPDVVHASGWIAYSCSAALRGGTTPLILSVRDYGYSCATRLLMQDGDRLCSGPGVAKCLKCASGRYGWPKAMAAVGGVLGGRSLLAHNPSAIHCVSRYVEKIVRRDFLREPDAAPMDSVHGVETIPDIVIIPNIMEPEAESDSDGVAPPVSGAAILAALPSQPFILYVGALQIHKGILELLGAYERLIDPPPLVLMGSVWPETPKAFPAGVTVFRNVPHPAVMEAWERCLFGVVPSVWPDPLPGTVREGMSRGKPIIGSAVGGIVDMVSHGESGLLVPPGDVEALRSAMAYLIQDAPLRERLGRTARKQAQRFADASILPRFEELYARIIGARQPA